ncbi:hypothetical protein F4818DRAFT_419452 [Hypoxylon cercidicola]|nr:hypothetical protein F4818DRAFT_419452 [Hypoxylon cercidicola]
MYPTETRAIVNMPGLSDSHWASQSGGNHRSPRRRGRRRRDSARSLSPVVRTASERNLYRPYRSTSNLPSQLGYTPRRQQDQNPELQSILSLSSQPELQQSLTTPQRPSPQFLQQELSRFMKITTRLCWKLPFLNQGYIKATETLGKSKSDIEAAEIQFKLDFHEFYMLLERALLRLMAIFQITVDGTSWLMRVPEHLTGLAASRHSGRQHRFHANVLAALEDTRNPLSNIFRAPVVREQLARAKDLRNRWKNIDEVQPEPIAPPPLKSYNLDQIVTTILAAIDQAHDLAVKYIRENGGEPVTDTAENWDFMVDAMDWEKV